MRTKKLPDAANAGRKEWIARSIHRVLSVVQAPFCSVCWAVEQAKAKLETRIANEEFRDE
jgi:hypothetical protein